MIELVTQDKEHKCFNIDGFVLNSAVEPGTIQSIILVNPTKKAFVELFKAISRPSEQAIEAKSDGLHSVEPKMTHFRCIPG